MDEQTRIERINLGHASAYAYYKAGGGTGTEEEFTQWMADLGIQVEYLENMAVVTNTLEPGTPASATYEDGVLTLNIPKGEKGDPAPQEEVTAATDAWLQENITNPSNPPLDRSLALANAAAPADMVGDLKSALNDRTLYATTDINAVFKIFDIGYRVNSVGRYSVSENAVLVSRSPNVPFLYVGSTFYANAGYIVDYGFWDEMPTASNPAITHRIAFQRGVESGTVITVPQDCYALISVMKVDGSAFDETLTGSEIIEDALTVNIFYKDIKAQSQDVPYVVNHVSQNNPGTIVANNYLVWGANIIDPSTAVLGKLNTDGTIVEIASYYVSDYFLCKPNTQYHNRTGATVVCFYDYKKEWISGASVGSTAPFTSPADACYIRMSSNAVRTQWTIAESSTKPDILPYSPVKLSEDAISIGEDSPYYKGEFSISKPDVYEWYECECLKENPNVFNFSLGSDTAYTGTQYADMISLYDQLVEDAEDGYITKTAIGTGSGTDINGNAYTLYEYAFVPREYSSLYTQKVTKYRPKILLDCCIHGFEKNASFAIFSLMYDVVHNWKKNSFLSTLRNFVEIRIVPVVDAWGFDNNKRNNANDVNLNRNFPCENWEPGEGIDYGGEEPLDQPEAAAIASWLQANSDMFFYATIHTNGHYFSTGYGQANPCMPYGYLDEPCYNRLYNAFVRHIERQTAVLPTEFELLTPSYNQSIGQIQLSTHIGTSDQYVCNYLKLALSMCLEGCNYFQPVLGEQQMSISTGTVKMNAEIFGNLLEEVLYEYAE